MNAEPQLAAAHVMVIGAGPIGATAAGQLASAGVGLVGVLDGGVVERSDLESQTVHFAPDLGANRAASVVAKLGVLNPQVQADPYPVEITADNADAIVLGFDLVLACGLGAEQRLLANDACIAAGVTLVDVSQDGASGSIVIVAPKSGACLRCAALPALGGPGSAGLAGLLGALAALEAIAALAAPPTTTIRREFDRHGRASSVSEIACDGECSCLGIRKAGTPQPAGKPSL